MRDRFRRRSFFSTAFRSMSGRTRRFLPFSKSRSKAMKMHCRWQKSRARKFAQPESSTHAISPSSTALSTRRCSAIHVPSSTKPRETFPFLEINSHRPVCDMGESAEAINLQFVDEVVGIERFGAARKAHRGEMWHPAHANKYKQNHLWRVRVTTL